MTRFKPMKSIALVGFMGSGKTSVAQRVSDMLNFRYVDADDVVEARAGKSIARIFEEDGEGEFRRMEQIVTTQLAAASELCIATGGGSFVNPNVRASLLSACFVVFLDAPFDVLWQRIAGDPMRPLLRGEGARERMRALYDERRPFYAQAHARVDATRPVESIALDIIERYRVHVGVADSTEG